MDYRHAHRVAQQAKFNNCPVLSVHKDYNAKGQVQWDILIGTDSLGGFKEATSPTRKESLEKAKAITDASAGYVTHVYAQRGDAMPLVYVVAPA